MKKVALITSGGDGAGINAVIHIIASHPDINLFGFNGGYQGILTSEPVPLTREVAQHQALGGVHYVQTGRSDLPYTQEGRSKLIRKLQSEEFECLIVCGGNGSQRAARLLHDEGMPTLFIPMTVDNDVIGSDYSIGYDTALNQLIQLLYGFHDTAANMPGRIFLIEVLGGNSGNLALESTIAGAADLAIVPEYSTKMSDITRVVQQKLAKQKSLIIVCSESAYENKDYQSGQQGVSFEIAHAIEAATGIRVRKSIAGFYLRAGRPSFRDASLGAKIGSKAAQCILKERFGHMVGVTGDQIIAQAYQDITESLITLSAQTVEVAKYHHQVISEGR
ncbi:6-phosphofructokinase 1 [Amphibacillus marinus]|uniref:6-phosphofructokinase n=1 Tax=Amphibacillus marinus TaxID=872970 RepID=A0A1H8T9P4_9BACI|nr:6-phosphofructokinase [Amphibacillus marinus]SEO87601.1 6-phosphofructokinase 1 [Amphibacillus marinus]